MRALHRIQLTIIEKLQFINRFAGVCHSLVNCVVTAFFLRTLFRPFRSWFVNAVTSGQMELRKVKIKIESVANGIWTFHFVQNGRKRTGCNAVIGKSLGEVKKKKKTHKN